MTANETIQDRTLRHQLFLTRLQTQEANQIVEFLDNDVIPDLEAQLARRLRNIRDRGFDTGPQTTQRIEGLLQSTREIVAGGMDGARKRVENSMMAVAQQESQWQMGALKEAMPIAADVAAPTIPALRKAVIARPFEGMPLSGWFNGLSQQTQRNIERNIRQGIVEGQTTGQIAQRLLGSGSPTRAMRRNAFAVAKTATLHASTQARLETFKENDDIVKGERWLSTLDARTCVECQALDGRVFDMDKGQRPPAHVGCRCTVTAVLKSWKEMGIDMKEAPPGTRASLNGQVPAKINYNQWLRQQVQSGRMDVVEEALGPSRAKLFAAGGLKVDQFTDRAGRTLTLKQLRARESEVFERLGPLPRQRTTGPPTIARAQARANPAPSVVKQRKSEIQRRLNAKSETDKRAWLNSVRDELPPDEVGRERRLIDNWTRGSKRKVSVEIKQAAQEELGFGGVAYSRAPFNIKRSIVNETRKDVRRIYERTQAEFARRGQKTVTLYRGLKGDVTTPGSVASWTTDRRIAESFNGGRIWKKEVPVEKILTGRGMPGWEDGPYGNQEEFLVLGGG